MLAKVVVDCQRKKVSFKDLDGKEVEFKGETVILRGMKLSSFELIIDEEVETKDESCIISVEMEEENPKVEEIPNC